MLISEGSINSNAAGVHQDTSVCQYVIIYIYMHVCVIYMYVCVVEKSILCRRAVPVVKSFSPSGLVPAHEIKAQQGRRDTWRKYYQVTGISVTHALSHRYVRRLLAVIAR